MATDRFGGIVEDDTPAAGPTPQRDRFGGLIEDDAPAPAAAAPAAPAVNPVARQAGDYIRSRMANGQKFDADTIAATYDAFEQQALGAHPQQTTAIAPENALERAALGVSRAVARPVTGAVGLFSPETGRNLRTQQADIYGHGGVADHDDTAGFVGETVGGLTQAPLTFSPVGRVLSAAEAAGNKRIDVAERRAHGEDISGLDELGNAAASAGIDLLANKANLGTVNKVVAGKLMGKPALEVGARLATEAAGATGIGFARTLADNAANRATSNDQTDLTAGIDLRSGIANAATGLALAGLTTRPTSRSPNVHVATVDGVQTGRAVPGEVHGEGVVGPVGPDGGGDPAGHGPAQDGAEVRPAQPGPDGVSAEDVVALQDMQARLDALQHEPVVPKTPEQLAIEQKEAVAEAARQEAFKQATFEEPPTSLDPEAQAAQDRIARDTAGIDFTDRRIGALNPVDPNPGRRFEDAAKTATFQTPEEAGANPFFSSRRAAAPQGSGQQPGTGGTPPAPPAPAPPAPNVPVPPPAPTPVPPGPSPHPSPTPTPPVPTPTPGRAPLVPAHSGVTPKPNVFQRAAAALRPRGNLPHAVEAFDQLRKGEAESQIKTGRNDLTELARAVKADTGLDASKLDPATTETMYKALQGDAAALGTLGPETQAAVKGMRGTIDAGTQKLLDEGAITDIGTRTHLFNEKGTYVQRKYRVHDDANFQPGKEAYDTAVDELMKPRLNKKGKQVAPGLSEDQAKAKIEAMLSDWKDAAQEGGSRTAKLGAQDLSTLIRRKNIKPWIRDLMGEEKSPFTAFAKTIASHAELAANAKFLDRTRAAGFGGDWLFENSKAPEGFTTRIAVPTDSSMAPLNGLRTTPEVAKAMNDIATTRKSDLPMAARMLVTANQWAKEAATVGSIMTQVRNALGQPVFNLASGHNPLTKNYGTAIKDVVRDQFGGKSSDLIRDATKYGVLGDNVSAHMLLQELGRAGTKDINLETNNNALSRARRAVSNVRGVARDAYAVPDNVGKLVGWQAEIKRAEAAYPGWTGDAQKAHAAEIIRNTYPSYSKLPPIIKAARFTPIGPFAGFWYESIRTYGNNLYYGSRDLTTGLKTGNKALAYQGSARLAGSLLVAAAGMGAAAASKKMLGISDEDEENLRKFQPGFRDNKNFVYTSKEPGKIGYADLSAFNPYASMFDAVRGFSRPNDLKGKLVEGVREFFGPMLGSEQLADAAITDVRRNKTQSGGRVYNPEDDFPKQWADITGHVLASVVLPGTAKRLYNKIVPALQGKQTPYGEALNPAQEISAEVTGLRQGTVNFDTSLGFKAREFLGAGRDIHSAFMGKAAVPGATEGDVVGAYDKSEEHREVRFKQMQQLVAGALQSGLSKSVVGARLKASGVTDDVIGQLFAGKYQPWNPAKSGLPEVEAVKGNKAYPVKPLMDRYRAAVAARKAGVTQQ